MKKVIFLLLDGARVDILDKLLESNRLPILKELIKNGTYKKAISVFPSTTGPAYLPFLMGTYPGKANMPGIRWLDKLSFADNPNSSNSHRSYVGYENKYFNNDIKKSIKSIFEHVPNSISIFNEITRGLKNGNDLTKYSKNYYKMLSHFYGSDLIDKVAFNKLIKSIDDEKQFYFSCFYSIDSLSHIEGSNTEKIKKLYEDFDLNLGVLIQNLKDKKYYDDTLIIVTSDHGHSDTYKHFDLATYFEKKNNNVFYYPLTYKKLYKKFNSSVMVSGNSMAHIYLSDNFDWSKQFDITKYELLINDLMSNEAVDILSCKNRKGEIVVISNSGKAIINDKESSIFYQPLEDDPFEYNIKEGLYSEQELLNLTFNSKYPDSIIQLLQIFKSNRCGDIVVSAKKGWDFRERFEIPEHKSSHGSLREEHMKVPIITNRKIKTNDAIRTVDLYPTVLAFIDKTLKFQTDGKKLDIY